jgi:hypothetical protein
MLFRLLRGWARGYRTSISGNLSWKKQSGFDGSLNYTVPSMLIITYPNKVLWLYRKLQITNE